MTHDRYFLDNVAQWILEIDRGEGIPFEGNYTAWLENREKRMKIEQRQQQARQRTLSRELEWIRMSPKARQAKSKARIRSYEEMSAQTFEERPDDLEIQIPSGKHLGDLVIEATGIHKAFGDKVLMDDLNFRLPAGGIVGVIGPNGTGKTTLSADPQRTLIGDDEHGWSDNGTFNFEGGCYAKTINLSEEAEPEIYATTAKFGTVIENMVYDEETKELDFEDDSLTANMRCAYPLHYISNASKKAVGGHPKNIIMLTCDAFGVLPPIARLTPAQAMYHFLSGFTSKVAGTERGVTEPEPTFSTCFGAPFMPRRPEVYGNLLREKIAQHGATCWLVNTGWTGGAYGTGSRMPIKATRALLTAALEGDLADVTYRKDANFGFDVPVSVQGVADILLDPRRTWDNPESYDRQAAKLVAMFSDNFGQYMDHIDDDVKAAAIGKAS